MIRNLKPVTKVFMIVATLSFVVACKLKPTYFVKDGQHLLNSNEVVVNGDETFKTEMAEVIRQKPNLKFGFRFRLMAYNIVDSARVQKRHNRMLDRFKKHNARKLKNQNEKNTARIEKALTEFPKVLAKNQKINAKRKKKSDKINEKRMKKMVKRYDKFKRKSPKYSETKKKRILRRFQRFAPYVPALKDTVPMVKYKQKSFKDTVNVRLKLMERLKYKFGEAPVIADTTLMAKSVEQLNAFLRSKGYYSGSVTAQFVTETKKKKDTVIDLKKMRAVYTVTTGERSIIDSVFLVCPNGDTRARFLSYIKKEEDAAGLNPSFFKSITEKQTVSIPFDANVFDSYRYELATYMANNKFYGFSEQNVYFKVDSVQSHNTGPKRMKLTVGISDRTITDETGMIKQVPFVEAKVHGVYFHVCDTTEYIGYKDSLDAYGLEMPKNNMIPTLDTFYYHKILKKVENFNDGDDKVVTFYKSSIHKNIFGKYKDSIAEDPYRQAYFLYNGEMYTNPALLECQNYMENDNYYKEYYIDRSYTRMLQLGLFDETKTEVREPVLGSGNLEMHYFLVPSIRRAFSVQPRATYVNGFIGVSASLSYSDINLRKKGTKMSFAVESGFEQNSRIIQDPTGKQPFFNTIEIGPVLKFDIPGMFPLSVTALGGKRQRPRTEISAAVNYQKRVDFTRNLVQFNYIYKFAVGKTQQVSAGLLIPVVKIVAIDKQPEFEQRINDLNDLFLKNAYNNQVIWETGRLNYTIDNAETYRESLLPRTHFSFNFNGNLAGCGIDNLISRVTPEFDAQGHRLIFGIPYSQFRLGDFKLIANVRFNKKRSLVFRALYGSGTPMANSSTSLPYDYSFSSGGANDVRAWRARSLGPGSYLSLLDPNAVATQIGDIRMEGSVEFRFGSGEIVNHALFVDAGNCWTRKYDPLRPGSVWNPSWGKQLALGSGYGLRLDFSFFIFRIDVAVPIFNPTLPEGSRWIYETKEAYNNVATAVYGTDFKKKLDKWQLAPFRPNINFGIGFPF